MRYAPLVTPFTPEKKRSLIRWEEWKDLERDRKRRKKERKGNKLLKIGPLLLKKEGFLLR